MKNTLSEEQRTQYQENGFLVIEHFLASGELEHWRQTRRRP